MSEIVTSFEALSQLPRRKWYCNKTLTNGRVFRHVLFDDTGVFHVSRTQSNEHATYLAPVWTELAVSLVSGSGVTGLVHPARSNRLTAK